MVTIKDVAKIAGVSPSTVSRVIKDHDGISDTTKKKVRKIMEVIGYSPNIAARNLVTNQSYTIGLVLKSGIHEVNLNPFFSDVNLGVSETCRKKGFSTLTTSTTDDDSLLNEVKELINSRQVDGFILLYSKKDDLVVNYLHEIDFPFVVVGKNIFDISNGIYVDNDNVHAAKSMTEFLISEGYRDIRMIVDNDVFAVSQDRIKGFEMALNVSGIPTDGKILYCDSDSKTLKELLKETFEESNPEAILTLDSVLNAKVISALYQLNIRIPEDVATATFNDSLLTKFASPPQTVVNIFPEELGKEASSEIIDLINNPDKLKRNITVPTSIIERQSTMKEEV
ncbi:LacI family DNA-binding transcriptional regulator [Salinicoccus sp. HZC-1]|uniref:LacI family DNA-binding transcriptional regulator n=1 Tax=Salinicoccus sp. HZC-1 TaxID=3385497 RepID=UPI00398B313E